MKQKFLNDSGLEELIGYIKQYVKDDQDVKPYASLSVFPKTGEQNIIYIDTTTNSSYYWDDASKTYKPLDLQTWENLSGKPTVFPPETHTHKKSDITDFPTSMPASDVQAWAKASTKPSYTKAEIGLGNVDNTADKDKEVKYATSAGSAGTAVAASSVEWSGIKNPPATYTPSAHTHGSNDITSLAASKITGIIGLDHLPAGALERCKIVADDAARFKLTTSDIQNGDVVKVGTDSNAKMYFVIDETKLSSEDGYTVFSAGTAASVPWSGIQNPPSTFPPSIHTHTISDITNIGNASVAYAGSAGTATKLGTSAGSATQPIYFSDGKPVATTYTLGKSVPSNAVFTDTNTWRPLGTTADTACAGNDSRLSNARPASDVYSWAKASTKPSYSWSEIGSKPSTFTPSSHTHNYVVGSYTGNGGQQKPNYFGTNKVGFLMMNTSVNGNSEYKDWMIMDSYSGNDVGGAVAIGVNRQSLHAYIMRSAAARDAWAESAELLHTSNYTSYTVTKTGSGASGTWGINISGSAGSVAWGNVSGRPSSLPASDVYAWAKASSKPSYSWSEISGKPSTFTPSSHTHNYAGSSSAGGSANSAILLAPAYNSNTLTTKSSTWRAGITDGYVVWGQQWTDTRLSNDSGDMSLWIRKTGDATTLNMTLDGTVYASGFSGALSGNASTATALTSSAGSATQPVYFSSGKPVACSYTLGKSVPSNAVFTDTNTWRPVVDNLNSQAQDQSLSAMQGKVLNQNKVNKSDIVNNLTSTSSDVPLSANMGRELNTKLGNIGKTAKFYVPNNFYVQANGGYNGLAMGGKEYSNIENIQHVGASDNKHYFTFPNGTYIVNISLFASFEASSSNILGAAFRVEVNDSVVSNPWFRMLNAWQTFNYSIIITGSKLKFTMYVDRIIEIQKNTTTSYIEFIRLS